MVIVVVPEVVRVAGENAAEAPEGRPRAVTMYISAKPIGKSCVADQSSGARRRRQFDYAGRDRHGEAKSGGERRCCIMSRSRFEWYGRPLN